MVVVGLEVKVEGDVGLVGLVLAVVEVVEVVLEGDGVALPSGSPRTQYAFPLLKPPQLVVMVGFCGVLSA